MHFTVEKKLYPNMKHGELNEIELTRLVSVDRRQLKAIGAGNGIAIKYNYKNINN
jgi:hypothetical protein